MRRAGRRRPAHRGRRFCASGRCPPAAPGVPGSRTARLARSSQNADPEHQSAIRVRSCLCPHHRRRVPDISFSSAWSVELMTNPMQDRSEENTRRHDQHQAAEQGVEARESPAMSEAPCPTGWWSKALAKIDPPHSFKAHGIPDHPSHEGRRPMSRQAIRNDHPGGGRIASAAAGWFLDSYPEPMASGHEKHLSPR